MTTAEDAQPLLVLILEPEEALDIFTMEAATATVAEVLIPFVLGLEILLCNSNNLFKCQLAISNFSGSEKTGGVC